MSALRLDTKELLVVVSLAVAIVALFAESLAVALVLLAGVALASAMVLIHSLRSGRNRTTIKIPRP